MPAGPSNRETEIKLSAPDPATARRLLRRRRFRVSRRRTFESNLVFDTPDLRLRSGGELLRLRGSGSESYLTYKGPPVGGKHKSREELEGRIDNLDTFQLVLERLGFQLAFRYEKYRTEFRGPKPGGLITLDETPVGTFFELEGNPRWIDATARQLGFGESDYIIASYGSLYLSYCEERNLQPAHMVFPPA